MKPYKNRFPLECSGRREHHSAILESHSFLHLFHSSPKASIPLLPGPILALWMVSPITLGFCHILFPHMMFCIFRDSLMVF